MRTLALMLLLAGCCLGQQITVRILNAKTGRPIANQEIGIVFSNGNGSVVQNTQRRTDQKGEARFEVPTPVPEHIFAVATLEHDWKCACFAKTDTLAVLSDGITANYEGKASDKGPRPVPGEVLLTARPFNWLEKILNRLIGY